MSLSQSLDDWLKPTEDGDPSVEGVDDPMGGIPDLPDLGLGSLSAEDMKWVDLEFLDLASGPFAHHDPHKNKNRNPTLGGNFPDIFFDSTSSNLFHHSFGGGQDDTFKDHSLDILADLFPPNEAEEGETAATEVLPTEDETTEQLLSEFVMEATTSVCPAPPASSEEAKISPHLGSPESASKSSLDPALYTVPMDVLEIMSESEKFATEVVEDVPVVLEALDPPPPRLEAIIAPADELSKAHHPPQNAFAKILLKANPAEDTTLITLVPLQTEPASAQHSFTVNTASVKEAIQLLKPLHLESLGMFQSFFQRPQKKRPSQPRAEQEVQPESSDASASLGALQALARHGIPLSSLSFRTLSGGKKLWLCPEEACEKAFDRPAKLKAHLFNHNGVKPFGCEHEGCLWAFTTSARLERHKESHRVTLKNRFACQLEQCTSTFSNIYNLKKHLKLHETAPKFQCHKCRQTLRSEKSFYAHLSSHDSTLGVFQCRACAHSCPSEHDLKVHGRKCAAFKRDALAVTCSFVGCGRRFGNATLLKTHFRIHTGDRPHACQFEGCGWSFRTVSKLRRHERKHKNIRDHVCSQCQKAFRRAEHLRDHRLTHLDTKLAHPCPSSKCGLQFAAQTSLDAHWQALHTNEALGPGQDNFKTCLGLSAEAEVNQRRRKVEEDPEGAHLPELITVDVSAITPVKNPRSLLKVQRARPVRLLHPPTPVVVQSVFMAAK